MITTLLIIIYVLMIIISIRPFKFFNKNGHLNHPVVAAFLWLPIWAIAILIAIVEGFKVMSKKKE